jgi:hypothetical protein
MKHILSILAAGILLWGCSLLGEPSEGDPEKVVLGDTTDTEVITGEVRYFELEGGFWAIAGDTANYEPMNLPETFERQALSVRIRGIIRDDMGSFRMIGPIVEIRSIEAR